MFQPKAGPLLIRTKEMMVLAWNVFLINLFPINVFPLELIIHVYFFTFSKSTVLEGWRPRAHGLSELIQS